jgi:hypothetical protein
MDASWMIPAVVVIVTLMERLGQRRDGRAQVPDSAMLTIAVVAATDVGSHHERAVPIMHECGSRSGRISVSRFHRRLHQRAERMAWIPDVVGKVCTTGDGFLIESLPLPVCRRVRGRACCGSCAATREKVVGWRVHRVCRPDGVPVAGVHNLTPPRTPAHGVRLACPLGRGGWVIPPPRAPLMRPVSWQRRGCAWFRCAG